MSRRVRTLRTVEAIRVTRSILERTLNDPEALIRMTADGIKPADLDSKVYDILVYLEKTTPKKPEEAEG